jgi:anhydro-N-acetylmuramic acid kinase
MGEPLFIGLMSGTSMDGIDAVLVRFPEHGVELLGKHYQPWGAALQARLRELAAPGAEEIERLGRLDGEVADAFADAALALLKKSGTRPEQVAAIGSHGQTIRHRPTATPPFSLQIGDPNRIAQRTGITTIADFRRRDLAAGGEGAPLVPAFHQGLFRSADEYRVVLNLGGIANLTLLPGEPDGLVRGFDCGPGNTLLDHWCRRHLRQAYDRDGAWGARGKVVVALLQRLLADPYLERSPPKSTGPEYFSPAWLEQRLGEFPPLPPEDVQATLCALTAEVIVNAIQRYAAPCTRVLACGGGVHNKELMRCLGAALGGRKLETTATYGLPPEAVEATAFAWLARQTLLGLAGNLPAVTGAREAVVLGGIHPGRNWPGRN